MNSIFTKIINKSIPSYFLAEDKNNLAILDINPLKIGHTIVIYKKEINEFIDMNQKDFLSMMNFVFFISKKIKKTIICKRIGISILGFQVPHVHVHIIPINKENDMNFSRKKIILKKYLFKIIQNTIKNNLI